MATNFEIKRNAGHPWDGRQPFDVLSVEADRKEDLTKFINKANPKYWATWIKGVDWMSKRNKWRSQFHTQDGTQILAGYFEIKDDAIKARETAEAIYHGEFSQSLCITGLVKGYGYPEQKGGC